MKTIKCECGHSENKHDATQVVWQPQFANGKGHISNTCSDMRCDCAKYQPAVMEKRMSPKAIVTQKAIELGATFNKVRTKAVSFSDLGRGDRLFIQFDGLKWTDGNKFDQLQAFAGGHGLIVTDSL